MPYWYAHINQFIMKIKNLFRTGLLCALLFNLFAEMTFAIPSKRQFYELRIYSVRNAEQETRVEHYLRDAYLPALHRLGLKNIGVFKPIAADTVAYGKKVYVLIPMSTQEQLLSLPKQLAKDAAYLSAGKDYIDAAYNNPPYSRFESIIMLAFEGAPVVPPTKLTNPKSERIYELRSYEAYTEKFHHNKIKMFNEGGILKLFTKLGFNGVFYGQVVAGSQMPNLMYMTTFSDKASRDAHWKTFFASPEWIKVKADSQYANNVSKNTIFFLTPTEYSDL